MTKNSALKRAVRSRMVSTGENYQEAHRRLLAASPPAPPPENMHASGLDFVQRQLLSIRDGQTPVSMWVDAPKVVLHMVPAGELCEGRIDASKAATKGLRLPSALMRSWETSAVRLDGNMTAITRAGGRECMDQAYSRVFSNGAVEMVKELPVDTEGYIALLRYREDLEYGLESALEFYRAVLSVPLHIELSLVNAGRCRLRVHEYGAVGPLLPRPTIEELGTVFYNTKERLVRLGLPLYVNQEALRLQASKILRSFHEKLWWTGGWQRNIPLWFWGTAQA